MSRVTSINVVYPIMTHVLPCSVTIRILPYSLVQTTNCVLQKHFTLWSNTKCSSIELHTFTLWCYKKLYPKMSTVLKNFTLRCRQCYKNFTLRYEQFSNIFYTMHAIIQNAFRNNLQLL